MRHSKILQKVRGGRAAVGTCLHLGSPELFEMVSTMGFDAIWLDLEHHSPSLSESAGLMRAARVGDADVVARPGKGEFMRMARMLEAGAAGIMYPRCESAAEAAEVVQWAKFAPRGKRGFDGSGPDSHYAARPMEEYLSFANEQTFIVVQIEDPEALKNVDEIAAVPGVDFLMLGPGDFSILAGIPGQFDHPQIVDALEKVANAAFKAGKYWAATCASAEQAQRFIAMGARLVFVGCDLIYVKQAYENLQAALATSNNGEKQSPIQGTSSHYLELP